MRIIDIIFLNNKKEKESKSYEDVRHHYEKKKWSSTDYR